MHFNDPEFDLYQLMGAARSMPAGNRVVVYLIGNENRPTTMAQIERVGFAILEGETVGEATYYRLEKVDRQATSARKGA